MIANRFETDLAVSTLPRDCELFGDDKAESTVPRPTFRTVVGLLIHLSSGSNSM